MSYLFVIFASFLISVNGQRPSFAGSRTGTGYKDGLLQNNFNSNNNNDLLGNRNSYDNLNGATTAQSPNLPIDAHGDAYLVAYWNSVPLEQRPFWVVNQQATENHRGTPSRGPSGSPTSSNTQNTQNTQSNTQNLPNRINTGGNNGFNGNNNFDSNINTSLGSQPSVVYPSNITPEQRIDMEIQFLQRRIDELQKLKRQLQKTDSQNSRSQRNF